MLKPLHSPNNCSPEGLGLLTVSGIPHFPELRQRLLPLAARMAVSGAAQGVPTAAAAPLPCRLCSCTPGAKLLDHAPSYHLPRSNCHQRQRHSWKTRPACGASDGEAAACIRWLRSVPAHRHTCPHAHRSEGKEQLESGGADVLKGSFYANPLLDEPTADVALQAAYPSYCRPNRWPRAVLPEARALRCCCALPLCRRDTAPPSSQSIADRACARPALPPPPTRSWSRPSRRWAA